MFKKQHGFTIVELLIVIVVIGILAAIVIVAFNGVQERANTTAVKSDLAAFHKKVEIYKINNPTDTYPQVTVDLESLGMKITAQPYATGAGVVNLLYCQSGVYTNYALLARTKSDKKFWISNTSNGPQEYTGSDTWNDGTDYQARCRTVLPTSSNAASAGHNNATWRPWTGVSN